MVLPCIGSLSQITGCPAARTASTSGGRRSPTFCAPHPRDQRQAPRLAARIEALAERQQLVAADLRADLAGHRVEHLGQQRHMGTVDLAGALADPRPVGRTEIDPALLVLAQHRQLVVEQQHLVAGPDRRGIRLLPGRGVPARWRMMLRAAA
ncbi:hypothetical protein PGPR2_05945 [Pseudomonas aeruginosa PGPR2]|nr:hypothetical protein PGPR2_05945 [Pseudomonas aeruginosa PGPR2]